MVPDSAGFVAVSTTAETSDEVIAAVLQALDQGFTVLPEQGKGRERRTWLDTFDWRLYRAGLFLEYVTARDGGELRLLAANVEVAKKSTNTNAADNAGRAENLVAEAAADRTPAAADRTPAAADRTPPATRRTHAAGVRTLAAAHTPAAGRNTPATGAHGAAVPPPSLVAAQPVTGWQASRPHPASDLPAGPVADRIGKLIAPRVLLPVATVTVVASRARLLNEDAKTVARLSIERPALAAAPDRAGVLVPRISVAGIRGYPAQARRAARIVSAVQGVTPATDSLLLDVLAARGRRPADYSSKVDAPITAGMPAARAVAVILLRLLDTIEANVQGVVRDTDTEFLHDLRVSVRRTRTGLKMLGDVFADACDGAGGTQRFAAEFKWLGDLTTPTRDLDVHLLGFDDMAGGLAAAKPDDLEPLRAFLRERRGGEYRALVRGLRSSRFGALTREWRGALTPISEKGMTWAGGRARSGEGPVSELAAERTRRAFAKVARRGAAITPDSPHEALHDLRKRCKELRYVLEFFAPLHDPAAYGKVVGDLKRLQDCLGEFQDDEVQIAEIRALADAMQAAGQAPAPTLLAMGEVIAGLAAGQASARAAFARRFTAFVGAAGQRRMAAALREGTA